MTAGQAQARLDELTKDTLAMISSFFRTPHTEFDLSAPLVLDGAEDPNENFVIASIQEKGVLCCVAGNSVFTRYKWEDLNINQLVWILEQLEDGGGEWEAEEVDDETED